MVQILIKNGSTALLGKLRPKSQWLRLAWKRAIYQVLNGLAVYIGEYRIDWGPGYRIYLSYDNKNQIVLFGGGTKKRQQADINEAKKLFKAYKRRKQKRGKKCQ